MIEKLISEYVGLLEELDALQQHKKNLERRIAEYMLAHDVVKLPHNDLVVEVKFRKPRKKLDTEKICALLGVETLDDYYYVPEQAPSYGVKVRKRKKGESV